MRTIKEGNLKLDVSQQRYEFLDLLRAFSVIIVIFAHFATWFAINDTNWLFPQFITNTIFESMGIFRNGGPLGVYTFFLISGFIITKVALQESRIQFLVKRVLRVLPLFVFSLLIAILIHNAYGVGVYVPTSLGYLGDFMQNINLFNPIRSNHFMNPVIWTLGIEVIFYTITFLLLGILKKYPSLTMLLEILIAATFILGGSESKDVYIFGYGLMFTSFCIILVGQATYFLVSNSISKLQYAIYCALSFTLFFLGDHYFNGAPTRGTSEDLASVVWAFLLFNVFYLLNSKLNVVGWVKHISAISYSLYLLHLPLMFIILHVLVNVNHVTYPIAVLISSVIIFVVAHVTYTVIEKPLMYIAKVITKRR